MSRNGYTQGCRLGRKPFCIQRLQRLRCLSFCCKVVSHAQYLRSGLVKLCGHLLGFCGAASAEDGPLQGGMGADQALARRHGCKTGPCKAVWVQIRHLLGSKGEKQALARQCGCKTGPCKAVWVLIRHFYATRVKNRPLQGSTGANNALGRRHGW